MIASLLVPCRAVLKYSLIREYLTSGMSLKQEWSDLLEFYETLGTVLLEAYKTD